MDGSKLTVRRVFFKDVESNGSSQSHAIGLSFQAPIIADIFSVGGDFDQKHILVGLANSTLVAIPYNKYGLITWDQNVVYKLHNLHTEVRERNTPNTDSSKVVNNSTQGELLDLSLRQLDTPVVNAGQGVVSVGLTAVFSNLPAHQVFCLELFENSTFVSDHIKEVFALNEVPSQGILDKTGLGSLLGGFKEKRPPGQLLSARQVTGSITAVVRCCVREFKEGDEQEEGQSYSIELVYSHLGSNKTIAALSVPQPHPQTAYRLEILSPDRTGIIQNYPGQWTLALVPVLKQSGCAGTIPLESTSLVTVWKFSLSSHGSSKSLLGFGGSASSLNSHESYQVNSKF